MAQLLPMLKRAGYARRTNYSIYENRQSITGCLFLSAKKDSDCSISVLFVIPLYFRPALDWGKQSRRSRFSGVYCECGECFANRPRRESPAGAPRPVDFFGFMMYTENTKKPERE